MQVKSLAFLTVAALVLQLGCSGETFKFAVPVQKAEEKPLPVGGDHKSVTFEKVYAEVFTERCTSCHGRAAKVNLESYAEAKKYILAIRNSVFEKKTMPKGKPLSKEQSELLATWINEGGEEGTPLKPLAPLEPKFASIYENIIKIRCIGCHRPEGEAFLVPLLKREDLVDSPLELVIPENPDESGMVISLERADDKQMPPSAMQAPVSSEEMKIIRDWISAGAKD